MYRFAVSACFLLPDLMFIQYAFIFNAFLSYGLRIMLIFKLKTKRRFNYMMFIFFSIEIFVFITDYSPFHHKKVSAFFMQCAVAFYFPRHNKVLLGKNRLANFFYIDDKLLFKKVRAVAVDSRLSSHMLGFFCLN